MSIDKLFINASVSQLGTGKNPTAALYSWTTKPEKNFEGKKTVKYIKIIKPSDAYVMWVIMMLKFWILLI